MAVKRHPHDSGHKHVAGTARYIDDLFPSQQLLHAAIGYAEIACGEVTELDLERVRSSQGVVDVITAEDIPGNPDIGPVFAGDPLLSQQIQFHGQPVFAVAATTHRLACLAVREAVMNCREDVPLLDLQQAVEQQVFVRPPHRMQRGDANAALAAAKNRLQGQVSIGGQEHFYLEGQAAVAKPEEDGGVQVYSSNQNPTEAQKLVAEVLHVPMRQVTIVTRRMGGGFGGKETQAAAPACLAALFAVRLQQPVSCRWSRHDDMVVTGKRHPFLNDYDVGFDDLGRIEGIQYRLAGQCGHSPDLSDAIVDRAMFHCDNAYFLPAVVIDGWRCKSNTASNTAFRGFGGPQGMLAMETVIDEIAYRLRLDPLDVRKRNFYDNKLRNLTPYHQQVETFTVPALVDQLEAESDYRNRRAEIDDFNRTSPVLRRGIALTPVKFGISFTVKHLNQGGALLHLYTDGSIQLNHGGTEMGQGLMTKVAQVVALELGTTTDNIEICATSTDKVPNTSATAASSGTDINGMAALAAARIIKLRLVKHLCSTREVEPEDLRFANNTIDVAGETLTLAELANEAYLARVSLSATGFYKTPEIHYDRENARGQPFYYYANGAAVSEVIVDTLTGEIKILRTDIIHDVGDSINPALDIGQIEGGFVQGAGWLTTEELKWNDRGRLLSDGPATYKIPAVADRPVIFNVRLLENTPNEKPTVLRSKAVGEPPLMLAISVWSAIRHAIASVAEPGVCPALNAPATPEEILRVITELQDSNTPGQVNPA
ncbi:MAG: xanthine dehydrogenase molybdopterin binding subunit [Gammaproteobacteria bacterium]|nr:xanthine dehydrogenase molybdopterin binding subunit [Gammaproteobacteria bacterium]